MIYISFHNFPDLRITIIFNFLIFSPMIVRIHVFLHIIFKTFSTLKMLSISDANIADIGSIFHLNGLYSHFLI